MLIISDLLAEIGFENIDSAADPTDAMAMLAAGGPRIVIAGLHLEPNGLQFLHAIRSDDRLKGCPFVLTAKSLSATEATALKNAGAHSVLLKPFRAEALEAKIQAAVLGVPRAPVVSQGPLKRSFGGALGRRFERSRH